jgi:GNAT superfamily N-acetyltransferase
MFKIAELQATDIPRILAANGGDWWRRDEDYWLRCLAVQALGHRSAAVATDGSGIVGYSYLNWQSQNPRFRGSNIPEISDLRVAEQYRRRGVATAIIAHLERLARRAGCGSIGIGVGMHRDYGPAQRLYAKLGYAPDGCGITFDNAEVRPGAAVIVDDALILWLVRSLRDPAAHPAGHQA